MTLSKGEPLCDSDWSTGRGLRLSMSSVLNCGMVWTQVATAEDVSSLYDSSKVEKHSNH